MGSILPARKLTVIWLFIIVFVQSDGNPCYRNGVLCPAYKITATYEDYEERAYPRLTWVSTTGYGESHDSVIDGLIERMSGYMGGQNDMHEEIDPVVPVRTKKVPFGEINAYTMSILLPPSLNDTPPRPTNPRIFVEIKQPTKYVVRKFGGLVNNESVWEKELGELRSKVGMDSSVILTHSFWCVYDFPWQIFNRRNEVWMEKTS